MHRVNLSLRSPIAFRWGRADGPYQLRQAEEGNSLTPIDYEGHQFPPGHLESIRDFQHDDSIFEGEARYISSNRIGYFCGSDFVALAAYLHNHTFAVNGETFSFIAMWDSPHFTIGLRVLRESIPQLSELWNTPWLLRGENSSYNGQNIFRTKSIEHKDNLFSNAEYEGLGWASVRVMKNTNFNQNKKGAVILVTDLRQDCYFSEVAVNDERAGNLLNWPHIIMAAIEDLSQRLGFVALVAAVPNELEGNAPLGDRLFSARSIYNREDDLEKAPGDFRVYGPHHQGDHFWVNTLNQ